MPHALAHVIAGQVIKADLGHGIPRDHQDPDLFCGHILYQKEDSIGLAAVAGDVLGFKGSLFIDSQDKNRANVWIQLVVPAVLLHILPDFRPPVFLYPVHTSAEGGGHRLAFRNRLGNDALYHVSFICRDLRFDHLALPVQIYAPFYKEQRTCRHDQSYGCSRDPAGPSAFILFTMPLIHLSLPPSLSGPVICRRL